MGHLQRLCATALMAVGLLTVSAGPCLACSCVQMTRAEAVDRADVVFHGTVVSRDDPGGGWPFSSSGRDVRVTFAVDEVHKGQAGSQVAVTTAADGAACGATFTVGSRYEVMASGAEALSTSLCAGNTELPALTQPPDQQPSGGEEAVPTAADAPAAVAEPTYWIPAAAGVVAAILAALAGAALITRGRRRS